MENTNFKAVLSTTVLPKDGIYSVKTVSFDEVKNLFQGVPHYIGHPATKEIVEKLGAVQAPSNLFEGLNEGEYALVVSIKQGKSNRVKNGFTMPHQDVQLDDLDFRIIYRYPI